MYGSTSRDGRAGHREAVRRRGPQATGEGASGAIPLEVVRPDQLFEELHGVPLDYKILNGHAERYIVEMAGQLPSSAPILIDVALSDGKRTGDCAQQIHDGIHHFFACREDQSRRERRKLFQEGLHALMISVPILILCLLLSQYIKQHVEEQTLAYLIGESLLIPGWVANWKPLEIFLYSWWPVSRRLRLYRRLAAAQVRVRAAPAAQAV